MALFGKFKGNEQMEQLIKIKNSDLNKIVEIHIKAFPGYFMTELGPRFLLNYYNTVLNFNKRIFLAQEVDGEIIGFIAGFLMPSQFYIHLNKNKIDIAKAIIPAFLRKPNLLLKLCANIWRVNKNSSYETKNICELASVAVDPNYSGRGLGKKLVKAFLNEAEKLGAEYVYLTTDARNNDYVNNFYKSLGFTLYRTFFNEYRREMNEYRYYFKK